MKWLDWKAQHVDPYEKRNVCQTLNCFINGVDSSRRVDTYTHILSYHIQREQTQTYRRKLGNTPPPPGQMDFAHAGSFIKKSSPGVFLWPALPSPLLWAPALTPHLGAISRLNVRLLYTSTHNAWGLAGKSQAYNTPSYRCVCVCVRPRKYAAQKV